MGAKALAIEPVMSEKEWSRILQRIEGGKVIPVIGEHLSVMSGERAEDQSLASYLADKLEVAGPPTTSLNEVAVRYLRTHPKGLDDLYTDIYQALPTGESFPLPAPLKQLAEIRHFNLFVSTSFDPYMALALNEVRFGRRGSGSTRVLAYERSRAVDIPERFAELDYPLVYHLFGKAEAAPIFAVADEDVLEQVHRLQAPECQPPNLAEALRDHRLLVLGTRLTGWLTRFFLRVSSADRLRDARRSDYLIDPAANADADQSLFFGSVGEVKLLPMSAVDFIDELTRRWKQQHPELTSGDRARRKTPAPLGAGDVFLSYASEDLAVVKALRERLEREAGVRVWLDRDELRGGDHWERRIADALRACALCVPVISARATASGFRFVRAEWTEALRLQAGRPADQPFILPIVIDETRPDDPALDPAIRALQWRRLHDDDDMRRFLAEIRAGVERAAATP
jgi:hypothetical protein